MLLRHTGLSHEITLYEEEISDVSLGTFYVFDKQKVGIRRHGLKFAQGGGCGCGRGSDIRLKRDIAQVGEHNGINLYRFRYLWSDTTYVGVMAQEVAALKPDAVSRGAGAMAWRSMPYVLKSAYVTHNPSPS
jgi:hypothetical protein